MLKPSLGMLMIVSQYCQPACYIERRLEVTRKLMWYLLATTEEREL
jgi:hypothetical protein